MSKDDVSGGRGNEAPQPALAVKKLLTLMLCAALLLAAGAGCKKSHANGKPVEYTKACTAKEIKLPSNWRWSSLYIDCGSTACVLYNGVVSCAPKGKLPAEESKP